MRKKDYSKATYVAKVYSKKGEQKIECLSITNIKKDEEIDLEEMWHLKEFVNKEDCIKKLSFGLNCCNDKTRIVWEPAAKGHVGTVYLFSTNEDNLTLQQQKELERELLEQKLEQNILKVLKLIDSYFK